MRSFSGHDIVLKTPGLLLLTAVGPKDYPPLIESVVNDEDLARITLTEAPPLEFQPDRASLHELSKPGQRGRESGVSCITGTFDASIMEGGGAYALLRHRDKCTHGSENAASFL